MPVRLRARHAVLALLPALIPGVTAAQAVAEPPSAETLLTVSAQGRVSRVPDVATIRAGVTTQGTTAAAALADDAARMNRVLAALRAAGIAPNDLTTAAVSLQPRYRYVDGQPPAVVGYEASDTVSVRFRDVARAGRVLDALVAQGANQIDGPTLSLEHPDAALDEARADAVKRARARAELYAAAAGLRVERIVSISEEGEEAAPPPVYRVRAQPLAAAPSTQLLPGEADVTATVSVRFVLH